MYAIDALLAKLYDGKYFGVISVHFSKELQRDTADLHYELLTTNADLVLSNKPTDMTALSPCQQEEADTRMMLHIYHAEDNVTRRPFSGLYIVMWSSLRSTSFTS